MTAGLRNGWSPRPSPLSRTLSLFVISPDTRRVVQRSGTPRGEAVLRRINDRAAPSCVWPGEQDSLLAVLTEGAWQA
jgi:hypothetical protein